MTIQKTASTLAIAAGVIAPSILFAQSQTFDLSVTDSDRPYGTAGYTFRVIPITVTDASIFRVDAINTVGTIAPVGIVDFIVFADGATIPEGPGISYSTQASNANSVGYFFDGQPNAQNPTSLINGPAGPMTEGNYQLIVAPYDSAGTGGDYIVSLELIGVTTSLAPVASPSGPTLAEEVASLAAASGTLSRVLVVDSRQLARLRASSSFASRKGRIGFALGADPDTGEVAVTRTVHDMPGMMGEIHTWFDVTAFRAEDDDADRSYTGRGLQFGADIALSSTVILGLSFGAQELDASIGAFSQDGTLRFAQPYLAYQAGAWSAEATLVLGLGDFDQTSEGGKGKGETRLSALTLRGSYDMALNPGTVLTPSLGIARGSEKVEGKSGTLAEADTETVDFTEISVGAALSRSFDGGKVHGGVYADWLDTSADTALVSDLLVDDGWTARIELGVASRTADGLGVDASVALSGLGGDLRQTSGGVRFEIRF